MKYLTDKQASAIKRATSLAFTWSYLVSLLASAVAIFYYAHLHQLGPGFTLMVFAMKFFVLSFLASWICLFVTFFVFKNFQSPENGDKEGQDKKLQKKHKLNLKIV